MATGYSQNDEEHVTLNYFGDSTGRFLDIGAYDGRTFSNTAALIRRGWSGVLVEPSPYAFAKLLENYAGVEGLKLVHCALGGEDSLAVFHCTRDGVSTFDRKFFETWKEEANYVDHIQSIVDVRRFLEKYPGPYDFVSIDAEGMDVDILERMTFDGTRMVCVEYGRDLGRIVVKMMSEGFLEIYRSSENLIFVRGADSE